MAGDKKYILLQNNHTISYDDDDCFKNDTAEIKDPSSAKKSIEIANDFKTTFYNNFLKKHYKNIVVLSAAGTSMDNGAKRGKSRIELWNDCKSEIDEICKQCPKIEDKKFDAKSDIEGFLSALILHEKVNDDVKNSKGESIRKIIEKKISSACMLELDDSKAPHKDFLNKITSRKPSDSRVQLFTTNYDTLFEQAANIGGFIVIDGFSFTQPRKFSGRYFDMDIVNREKTRIKQEESFYPKVFQLYKLHGSLTWNRNKTTNDIEQVDEKSNIEPLVIYPASEKYESSYEQPYFEMMSRFQQSLRKENTLLIVIGFGFQDKHIQNVIFEAVEQNPSFQLLISQYNPSNSIDTNFLDPFFIDKANMKVKRNVNIVFDKFSDFTNQFPSNQVYYDLNKNPDNDSI